MQALKESFGAADLQQTPSSRPPHVAHSTTPEASSSRPAGPPAAASRACEEDSDEFESASESEYDTSKEARTDAGLDDEALARAAEQAVAAETEAEVDELADQASSLLVTGTDATAFASTSVEVPSARPSISASSTSKSSGNSIFGSKGMFGGLMKGLGASSSSTAPSVPIPDETIGTPLASIEGSWLSHLEINGKRTWAIATERPERWQPVADALASDCRVRADLVTLSTGDLKGAQKVKEAMEDRQRADKRIREAVIGRGH